MNIVVCGGRQQADYLLSVFANKRGNRIVVINDDEKIADTISEHYGLDVIKSLMSTILILSSRSRAAMPITLSPARWQNSFSISRKLSAPFPILTTSISS